LARFLAFLPAKNVTKQVWSAVYYNNAFCKTAIKAKAAAHAMQNTGCQQNKTNFLP
jgi:hypothetical protein